MSQNTEKKSITTYELRSYAIQGVLPEEPGNGAFLSDDVMICLDRNTFFLITKKECVTKHCDNMLQRYSCTIGYSNGLLIVAGGARNAQSGQSDEEKIDLELFQVENVQSDDLEGIEITNVSDDWEWNGGRSPYGRSEEGGTLSVLTHGRSEDNLGLKLVYSWGIDDSRGFATVEVTGEKEMTVDFVNEVGYWARLCHAAGVVGNRFFICGGDCGICEVYSPTGYDFERNALIDLEDLTGDGEFSGQCFGDVIGETMVIMTCENTVVGWNVEAGTIDLIKAKSVSLNSKFQNEWVDDLLFRAFAVKGNEMWIVGKKELIVLTFSGEKEENDVDPTKE